MDPGVIVGAAIVRAGALLAAQRAHPADLAGYWELPGGRVEPGESAVDALRRECVEELDVRIAIGERVGEDVALPGGKVLRVYSVVLTDPGLEPVPLEHRALRWISEGDLDGVDWLPADRVLLPALRNLLTVSPLHRLGG
ncbi:MAG: (deoxy)nucleoside triphosphate pyrophosphohydrolase [Haloechinothrix sp.]